MSPIRSVLRKNIEDKELLRKAELKLSTLKTRDIRLIGSLCERISHDRTSAGSDVAFLLVTALIILS
jgi:hypothetical protein